MAIFVVILAILASALANHGHHAHRGNHGTVGHATVGHATPFVSSFSHKLPGTNSYMSVTRYFGAPGGIDRLRDNQSRQGHAVQDNFHPWNPRFQVNKSLSR